MVLPDSQDLTLEIEGIRLNGNLSLPKEATGLVVFAHGSGSSRLSVRNQAVARKLNVDYKLGTLLFDLLSPDEEPEGEYARDKRFDIPLLSRRVAAAVEWCQRNEYTGGLAIGCFGASTGAAAAIRAAASQAAVKAVVSRGGRVDLADEALDTVTAPVLMIVGENDPQVLQLNHEAANRLKAKHKLTIIPHATHLFEEPGTLDEAADHAGEWFQRHLR